MTQRPASQDSEYRHLDRKLNVLAVLEHGTWAERHLLSGIKSANCTVEPYFYGDSIGEFYGRSRQTELIAKHKELLARAHRMVADNSLDLIFCYAYDDFLCPDLAPRLAALNVPMVNLNVDMENQWYRQIRSARYFTKVLCAQRQNMDALADYGANTLFFPMAARTPLPGPISPDADVQPAAPVTFVGAPMPYRKTVLRYLLDSGVPLAVYGNYWREGGMAQPDHHLGKTLSDLRNYLGARMRHEGLTTLWDVFVTRLKSILRNGPVDLPVGVIHGFVPEGGLNSLFAKSAINIGFTRMTGEKPWGRGSNQIKLRDFEIPMAGGFYLVEYAPGYEECFVPGVEIETWRSPDELLEKIHYYLEHEAERMEIARRAKERALRDHTWKRRFDSLFAALGLPGS